jgi:hypothetical protein
MRHLRKVTPLTAGIPVLSQPPVKKISTCFPVTKADMSSANEPLTVLVPASAVNE